MESPHNSTTGTLFPRRRAWGQFSLFSLLLLLALGCVLAAYWGERRRRAEAEEQSRRKDDEIRRFHAAAGLPGYQPGVLSIKDLKQVYIRAVTTRIGARDEPGWAWRIYLPPGTKWSLHVSQGAEWDEKLGRFVGGLSATDIEVSGELTLDGCLSYNSEGGRWIQNWVGGQSVAFLLSDAGVAALRSSGESTRTVTGQDQQQAFAATGQIELLRWHRTIRADAPGEGPNENTAPPGNYGFSIFLAEDPLRRDFPH